MQGEEGRGKSMQMGSAVEALSTATPFSQSVARSLWPMRLFRRWRVNRTTRKLAPQTKVQVCIMEELEHGHVGMRQSAIVGKAPTAGDRLIRRLQGSMHADCDSHV